MKNVPISAAREIGKKYQKDQVIMLCWDKTTGDTWVTTWGKSIEDCKQAAEGGNKLKTVLGWPEKDTHATPVRLKKKGVNL